MSQPRKTDSPLVEEKKDIVAFVALLTGARGKSKRAQERAAKPKKPWAKARKEKRLRYKQEPTKPKRRRGLAVLPRLPAAMFR